MRISPLFKVDGEKDTYIFDYGFNTWGAGYWVKKMEKGWRVVQTYMIIS
jgi:agmatine/peptidylarginine deiminase